MNEQQYDNNNRGALFLNDRGGNEKAPNYKGSINIEGVEYWCSLWKQTSKKGDVYLSISVKPKQEQARKSQPQSGSNQQHNAAPTPIQTERILEEDDIPF